MFDRDMRYIAASPKWLGVYGRKETPVGLGYYEDFPQISAAWKAAHQRCLAGATEENAEGERLARADGAVMWVTWETRPWRDGGGAIGGIVIAGDDVTARVEADKKAADFARRLAASVAQLEGAARRAQAAEQRLSDAVEAIPVGFAIFDPDDRLVVCNKATRDMHPSAADAFRPGATFEHLLRATYERKSDDGAVADEETWVRNGMERRRNPGGAVDQLTGAGRWLRIEERPMPDGGVVALWTDVTGLEARERDLALKTALLEATLHHMGEGIHVFDAGRRLQVGNESAARLLDLPPELCRPGGSLDEMARFRARRDGLGEFDIEALVEERAAWFRAGRPFARTMRLPDGRTIDARFSPMPGGGGVFMFRDVTERADYEAKLAEKNALLEATLHNMGEGIAVFDASRRFLVANEIAIRQFGGPPELCQPGALYDDSARYRAERGDYGDGDVEALVAERVAVFHERKLWNRAQRFLDGRTIETRFNPMPGGGGVFVFRDVSELADKQAALTEALAKAEQGSRAKSEFLAMASHELRTPMNAIIGMAVVLREADLKPAERLRAATIEAAGESLLVIINDLLEFASLDAGRVTLETAPFDVGGLAASAIDIARNLPQAAGLTIAADVDPAVPAGLLGDGGRIRRILVNLLDNAVKHTGDGSVTLRARIASAAGAASVTLRIEIEDTGAGFPPSEAPRFFQPFERGALADRTRDPGLGLGLAISKRLVDLMGGTIGAESAPGAGSRFWFEIPVGVAPQPSRTAAPQAGDGRRPLKILVAEDIEANREVMRAMLQKLGHEAHFAEDGAEAIEAVGKDDYDVILMDIQMPNVDGLEATQAIRGFGGRFASLPIIAVSAYSQQGDKDAAYAAGMSEFLTKPVRRSVLDAALRAYTETRDNPQVLN